MDNFVDKINIARKESKVLAGLKGSKKYKEIKINLLVNLENQGIADQIMIDLVEEYMSLWITSKLLTIDIEKRGVSQTYNNEHNFDIEPFCFLIFYKDKIPSFFYFIIIKKKKKALLLFIK